MYTVQFLSEISIIRSTSNKPFERFFYLYNVFNLFFFSVLKREWEEIPLVCIDGWATCDVHVDSQFSLYTVLLHSFLKSKLHESHFWYKKNEKLYKFNYIFFFGSSQKKCESEWWMIDQSRVRHFIVYIQFQENFILNFYSHWIHSKKKKTEEEKKKKF